jgi:uncharacterized protein YjbI with pentapeptide repeats
MPATPAVETDVGATMTDEHNSEWRRHFTRARLVEHEQWYQRRPAGHATGRIDLSAKNLRGARVRGIEGARLVDCDLSGSSIDILDDAELLRCNFTDGALGSMERSNLADCSFERARMEISYLKGAVVRDCVFAGALLARSRWEGARVASSMFVDAQLTDAELGGLFDDCRFVGADLRRTVDHLGQTAGGTFIRCDFTGADLDRRMLGGATFERCTFDAVRGNPVADRTTRLIRPVTSGPDPAWFSACSRG